MTNEISSNRSDWDYPHCDDPLLGLLDRILLQVPRGDINGTVEEVLQHMSRFIERHYPGLWAGLKWEVING